MYGAPAAQHAGRVVTFQDWKMYVFCFTQPKRCVQRFYITHQPVKTKNRVWRLQFFFGVNILSTTFSESITLLTEKKIRFYPFLVRESNVFYNEKNNPLQPCSFKSKCSAFYCLVCGRDQKPVSSHLNDSALLTCF